MRTWQERADKAKKRGYLPGNLWERKYLRHLKKNRPELIQELGPELRPFVESMTADAMDTAEALEKRGMNPLEARQLAMEFLLGVEPIDPPETWEGNGAVEDAQAAVLEQLT